MSGFKPQAKHNRGVLARRAGAVLWSGVFACLTTASQADVPEPQGDLFGLSLQDLARIQVASASLSPQSLEQSPYSVSVITADHIRRLGARTILDVLRHVPGLRVDISNRGRPVIAVRGMRRDTSDYLLFLLDGHPINEPATGSATFHFDLSRLPLHNIDHIEVVRGPGSAVHGANAFVGTINIVTRSGAQIDGTELSFRHEFEADGSIGQEYHIDYGGTINDDADLALSLNVLRRDGERIFIEPDIAGRSGHADTRFDQIDAQGLLEFDRLRVKGRFTHVDRGEFAGAINILAPDDSYLKYDAGFVDAEYGFAIGPLIEAETRLYFDHMTGTARIAIPADVYPPGTPFAATGAFSDLSMDITKLGANLQFTYGGLSGHTPSFGISLEHQRQDNLKHLSNDTGSGTPVFPPQDVTVVNPFGRDVSRNLFALYAEDIWQLSDQLHLNAGLRYDDYSDFGGSLNPRLGLKWAFDPNWSLRATYGTAFRAPDFRSLYLVNAIIQGNPELEEEEIETFELGLAGSPLTQLEVGITLFHNNMDQLIARTAGRFENIQQARSRGVELEARYDIKPGSYVAANYSYVDSQLDGGTPFPDEPRHSASLMAGLRLSPQLDAGATLYWQASSPRSAGDSREALDGYAVTDLNLQYRGLLDGLTVEFAVYNLFDSDYRMPSSPSGVPNDYPGPGRSLLLGMQYQR